MLADYPRPTPATCFGVVNRTFIEHPSSRTLATLTGGESPEQTADRLAGLLSHATWL